MATSISASQSLMKFLPSDSQLGVDASSLKSAAQDLTRFAVQTDSVAAKWGYQALGTVFEFGRNVITPLQETRADLDRFVRQSESRVIKGLVGTLGAGFGLGSVAYETPHNLLWGAVDVVADPIGMVAQLPGAVEHNGNAMVMGSMMLADGRISEGTALVVQGTFGDYLLVQGGRMAVKVAPGVYGAYVDAVNSLPRLTRSSFASHDPINIWMAHPERGGVVLSGVYKGTCLPPFRMKTTPVTNAEWLTGLKWSGANRYVDVAFDSATGAIEIRNVSTQLPQGIHPWVDLDAGEVLVMGPRIMLKMVDNPSRYYDGVARLPRFGASDHPVVNISPIHAKVWLQLQTEATGGTRVYRLPTDLEFEAAASNFGSYESGLHPFRLLGRGFSTAPVDTMPLSPSGVQVAGNVWSWTEFNPGETQPFGLRGGAWTESSPMYFRADYRSGASHLGHRSNNVGLRVVVDETP